MALLVSAAFPKTFLEAFSLAVVCLCQLGSLLFSISPSTCCHILSRILGEGQGMGQGLDRSATLKVKAGWGREAALLLLGEVCGIIINLFKGIPFGIR